MKQNVERKTRRLILVGAGHAHIEVLRYFSMNPIPDLDLVLVNPSSEALYSGMLPGLVAGLYSKEDITIDVAALSVKAGAVFLRDQVVKINAEEKRISLRDRPDLAYDFLSLNIGSASSAPEGFFRTRPFSSFLQHLQHMDRSTDAVRVVGAGAAGVAQQ